MTIDRRAFLRLATLVATGAVVSTASSPPQVEILPGGFIHCRQDQFIATPNFGQAGNNLVIGTGWPEEKFNLSGSTESRLESVIAWFCSQYPNHAFVQSYLGSTLPSTWNLGKPLSLARGQIDLVLHSAGVASFTLAFGNNPDSPPNWLGKIRSLVAICPAISLDAIHPSLYRLSHLVNYPTVSQTLAAFVQVVNHGIPVTIYTAPGDKFIRSDVVLAAFKGRFGNRVELLPKPNNSHGLTPEELIQIISRQFTNHHTSS